jgi:antirestriction protein ArdC
MSTKTPIDKYELITSKLLEIMEKDILPWRKPWYSSPFMNPITGTIYSGINPLICSIDCLYYGYTQSYFITFLQAKDKGWKVKKGSKSTWIRKLISGTSEKENDQGEVIEEGWKSLKFFQTFNIECIDDSESDIKIIDVLPEYGREPNPDPRLEEVEAFIKGTGAVITFGGDRAFYAPGPDRIRVPNFEDFTSAKAYYGTLLHELSHWTGHESRLARDLSGSFGSQKYAAEELVAELSACFLSNHHQLDPQLEHHASYLQSWMKILKEDKSAFFKAASLASKAANWVIDAH